MLQYLRELGELPSTGQDASLFSQFFYKSCRFAFPFGFIFVGVCSFGKTSTCCSYHLIKEARLENAYISFNVKIYFFEVAVFKVHKEESSLSDVQVAIYV